MHPAMHLWTAVGAPRTRCSKRPTQVLAPALTSRPLFHADAGGGTGILPGGLSEDGFASHRLNPEKGITGGLAC